MAHAERFPAAVLLLGRSLALSGDDAVVCSNLGNALGSLGRRSEAGKAYRRAAALAPSFCAPHFSLASLEADQDRKRARLLRAVACEATYVPALLALAQTDAPRARRLSTRHWMRRALALSPEDRFAHAVAANALLADRRPDLARIAALRARSVGGDIATIFFLLARAADDSNDLDDARRRYRQCLSSAPGHGPSLVGLGSLELGVGRPHVAVTSYGRAVAVSPADDIAAGNLLFASAFLEHPKPQAPTRSARRWAATRQASPASPPSAAAEPAKGLRIGYVSPEFLKHSFLFQLLPVLEHHDRSQFQVFAYGQAATHDDWTDRVRARVDVWRNLSGLDLDGQADAIQADGIDVLVNLTGYLAHHRALFLKRVAAAQVAYINHVAPTGLATIDARITDDWLEPAGAPFVDAGEQLVRMETGFSCLSPPSTAPEPGALPAASNGFVTFGVVNNLAKVSRRSLDAWTRILARLPTARIFIKAYGLSSAAARRALVADFERSGVDGGRVTLIGRIASDRDNLQTIAQADIALDPFPFNGGLSTGDALWMGVPVVSMAGSQLVGRLGLSLLHRAGFPDWAVSSVEDYVELAVALAADADRLATLRRGMRDSLQRSVLFDAASHTRELEGVYRDLWRRRTGQRR